MRKTGRPSKYNTKIAADICERMVLGNSIRSICASEGMPREATLYRWLTTNSEFREQYRASRELQAEAFFEEMLREATDRSGDFYLDGNQMRPNSANVMRSKVITDNLKWVLGRMNPKKYGAVSDIANSQPSGPITFRFADGPVTGITRTIAATPDSILQQRIRDLEEQLRGRAPEQPPRLLTHDPGPLPKRMDREIAERLKTLIRDYVRKDDQRAPETVLDEVLFTCKQALIAKYGLPGEPLPIAMAANGGKSSALCA